MHQQVCFKHIQPLSFLQYYRTHYQNLIYFIPIGCAASNINGGTLHSTFCLNHFHLQDELPKKSTHDMIHKFKRVLLFITDERSMLSSELIAACNKSLTNTIYGGVCNKLNNFGHVPVVMILGDDAPLPPVIIHGKGKGAFYSFCDKPTSNSNSKQITSEAFGSHIFRDLADTVMELNKITRQKQDNYMQQILDDLEQDRPSRQPAEYLLKLHLMNFSEDFNNSIQRKSIYICATHADKDHYNSMELAKICTDTNPLACMKYIDRRLHKCSRKQHFGKGSIPIVTYFCVGAKVEIKGKNFCPSWGLYNGAIGTGKEIVFRKIKTRTWVIFQHMSQLSYHPINHHPTYLYSTKTILKLFQYPL